MDARLGAALSPLSPGIRVVPAARPTRPTYQDALIVDATSGEAAVYAGYGMRLCSPERPPTLFPAVRVYSVPFDEEADGSFIALLPACGKQYSAMRTHDSGLEVLVSVPVGPCNQPPTTKRVEFPGLPQPVKHAPVGLVSTNIGI
jgi:hypothetical protein